MMLLEGLNSLVGGNEGLMNLNTLKGLWMRGELCLYLHTS